MSFVDPFHSFDHQFHQIYAFNCKIFPFIYLNGIDPADGAVFVEIILFNDPSILWVRSILGINKTQQITKKTDKNSKHRLFV